MWNLTPIDPIPGPWPALALLPLGAAIVATVLVGLAAVLLLAPAGGRRRGAAEARVRRLHGTRAA